MHAIRPVLVAVLALAGTTALASDTEFSEAAKRRMKLDFDLDAVEAELEAPMIQFGRNAPAASPHAPRRHMPVPQAALPLEPNSTIRTVTVFRDRAQVTRHLTSDLQPGMQSITFEGLPMGIVADSLQAGLAGKGARIVGVELVSAAAEVDDTKRIEGIRDEAKKITAELGDVRDRIEALLAQRSYLRSTLLKGQVQGQSRPALTEVRSSLEFVGKAEQQIAADLRVQEEKAKELGEDLMPLLVKLKNPIATGQKVRVEVDASKAASLDVSLRYQVTGASWIPSYNARLATASKQMDLDVQGVVTQHTREDWTDVDLFLSTANPSRSGTAPSLQPWYLGRENYGGNYNLSSNLAQGGGHYGTGEGGGGRAGGDGVIASDMQAAVEGGGAVVFAVKGKRTVKGDGSSQRIPVGSQTLATEIELASVPKLMPELYRRARIRYDGAIPLLPGPIASYVDGDYVGSGQIASVVPGEEFTLAFGTEDRIKVERVLVARKQEFLGVGRRTVRYTFHFRVNVHNFSGTEQAIELSDQVPVSELDRVSVKVLEVSDGGRTDKTDSQGLLTWNKTVASGAETAVEFQFSVTGPVDSPQLRQMQMMF